MENDEKITILRGHKGRVDFSYPIKMSDERFSRFQTFLNTIFEVVDINPKKRL